MSQKNIKVKNYKESEKLFLFLILSNLKFIEMIDKIDTKKKNKLFYWMFLRLKEKLNPNKFRLLKIHDKLNVR